MWTEVFICAAYKIYKEVHKVAKIEEKKPIVQEIKDNLDGAKSVVLVDYLGVTVEQDTKPCLLLLWGFRRYGDSDSSIEMCNISK